MDNRSKIFHAALELFASRGYDGIGVQEITEAAGITKPTLYHYFGSKEGLLTELLREYFGRLCLRLRQAAEYRGDLPFTLTQIVNTYYEFAKSNQAFYRLQMSLMFAPPESNTYKLADQFAEEPYHILETMFEQASQQHGNMLGRHKMYAATFIGFINTYASILLAGKFEHKEQFTYQVLHQFMHGIYS